MIQLKGTDWKKEAQIVCAGSLLLTVLDLIYLRLTDGPLFDVFFRQLLPALLIYVCLLAFIRLLFAAMHKREASSGAARGRRARRDVVMLLFLLAVLCLGLSPAEYRGMVIMNLVVLLALKLRSYLEGKGKKG